jgi:squalene-hopene/tetraprenyl-beta-curcumene cyclase
MNTRRYTVPALLVAAGVVGLTVPPERAPGQAPAKAKAGAREWEQSVDKAVAYLRRTQAKDGSWGGAQAPGVTGLVVAGLMRTTRLGPKDPMVERALKYIESLRDPKTGHLAGKGAHVKLQNYVTCANVLALTSADPVGYKAVIDKASKFLRRLQWDEGEGKTRDSDFYGGAGYDSKSRPDLSNTQMFLDALVAARVPRDDPAFKKAAVFVSRCQNLKGEHNDQPWAAKIDDGSFIYTAATGGVTKVQDKPGPDGELPGYGSMTFAGIKSLLYCGVGKDDARVQKALGWVRKHYAVDRNPGMPKARAQWGLYYYYLTMARCLNLLGEDVVVDAKGARHDWRAELTAALAGRQRPDGAWVNDSGQWMESNAHLVTAYALLTLAECKPRK